MIEPNSSSDAVLIRRAQNSDIEAFGEIFERYARRVFHFIFTRIGNKLDAEDLTDEVFLRAWRALPNYQERGLSFAPFLFRITRNALADHYHENGRTPESISIHEIHLEDDADGIDPVLVESNNRRYLELVQAIGTLKKDYQDVLVLRFLNDLPPTEVAKIMGRSPGAIRTLQHRALNALRKIILLLAIAVFSLGATGVTSAASASLPGDNLYNIKLAIEDMRLGMSLSLIGDAQLQAQYTELRLEEINALILEGRYEDVALAAEKLEAQLDIMTSTLEEFSESGEVEHLIGLIDSALMGQIDNLSTLLENNPGAANGAIQQILNVSLQGQEALQKIQNNSDSSSEDHTAPAITEPEQEDYEAPLEEDDRQGNQSQNSSWWKDSEGLPNNGSGQVNAGQGNSEEPPGDNPGQGNGNQGNQGQGNGNNGNGNGNGNGGQGNSGQGNGNNGNGNGNSNGGQGNGGGKS